jgi:hypothetical protein
MVRSYNIYDLMKFKVKRGNIGKRLETSLLPYKRENMDGDIIELSICPPSKFSPRAINRFSGTYKGINWELAFIKGENGLINNIFFYSSAFTSFLLLRIVLIPIIKKVLITNGGFYVLGSSWSIMDTTYFLFGYPGVGKSHLTLKAMEAGASLIGDGALLIFANGEIRGLINEIELRYRTIKNTLFQRKINNCDMVKLCFYQIISCLTRRKISFNISIEPSTFGCKSIIDNPKNRHVAVHLTPANKARKMSLNEFMHKILSWNDWYESIFGDYFSIDPASERNQLKANIEKFLSNCTLWEIPTNSDHSKIISL